MVRLVLLIDLSATILTILISYKLHEIVGKLGDRTNQQEM